MSLVSFDFFVFFTVFFLFTGGRGYTQKTSKHHDRRIDLIQSNAWEIKNGVSSMCENKRRDRRSIDLKFQYLYCFFLVFVSLAASFVHRRAPAGNERQTWKNGNGG